MTNEMPASLRERPRSNPNPVAAARALRPIIEAGADEA